jgi:hypothetical protein
MAPLNLLKLKDLVWEWACTESYGVQFMSLGRFVSFLGAKGRSYMLPQLFRGWQLLIWDRETAFRSQLGL